MAYGEQDIFIRIAGRGVKESVGSITINCYSGFCLHCHILINSHSDEQCIFNSISCCELYELAIDSGYTGERLYIPICSNSRISRFSYEDRCSVYMKDIRNAMMETQQADDREKDGHMSSAAISYQGCTFPGYKGYLYLASRYTSGACRFYSHIVLCEECERIQDESPEGYTEKKHDMRLVHSQTSQVYNIMERTTQRNS